MKKKEKKKTMSEKILISRKAKIKNNNINKSLVLYK